MKMALAAVVVLSCTPSSIEEMTDATQDELRMGLTAVAISSRAVALDWSMPVLASGLVVERKLDDKGTDWGAVVSLAGDQTHYVDASPTLNPGAAYFYRVIVTLDNVRMTQKRSSKARVQLPGAESDGPIAYPPPDAGVADSSTPQMPPNVAPAPKCSSLSGKTILGATGLAVAQIVNVSFPMATSALVDPMPSGGLVAVAQTNNGYTSNTTYVKVFDDSGALKHDFTVANRGVLIGMAASDNGVALLVRPGEWEMTLLKVSFTGAVIFNQVIYPATGSTRLWGATRRPLIRTPTGYAAYFAVSYPVHQKDIVWIFDANGTPSNNGKRCDHSWQQRIALGVGATFNGAPPFWTACLSDFPYGLRASGTVADIKPPPTGIFPRNDYAGIDPWLEAMAATDKTQEFFIAYTTASSNPDVVDGSANALIGHAADIWLKRIDHSGPYPVGPAIRLTQTAGAEKDVGLIAFDGGLLAGWRALPSTAAVYDRGSYMLARLGPDGHVVAGPAALPDESWGPEKGEADFFRFPNGDAGWATTSALHPELGTQIARVSRCQP